MTAKLTRRKKPPSDKILNDEWAIKKPTTTRKSLGVVHHIDRPQAQVTMVNYDVSNQRSQCKPESAFGKNYEKISKNFVTHKENHGKVNASEAHDDNGIELLMQRQTRCSSVTPLEVLCPTNSFHTQVAGMIGTSLIGDIVNGGLQMRNTEKLFVVMTSDPPRNDRTTHVIVSMIYYRPIF